MLSYFMIVSARRNDSLAPYWHELLMEAKDSHGFDFRHLFVNYSKGNNPSPRDPNELPSLVAGPEWAALGEGMTPPWKNERVEREEVVNTLFGLS
jgi:hypothetical protein